MKRLRHPIRAIREPFGTAGLIVACVALVLATTGAAFAAKGALTGKQKKEVEKIAKKFAGKPGEAGAPGAPGAPGKDGVNGANGKDGVNGTNGVGATTVSFTGSKGTCTQGQGGIEVKSAGPATFVCNGEEGEAGEAGETGQDAGFNYVFNSSTAEADPGTGKLSLNNASAEAATLLWISETDSDANPLEKVIAGWASSQAAKGTLLIRKAGDPTVFAEYTITGIRLGGSNKDEGTFDKFSVAYVQGNGSLANDDPITVAYFASGSENLPTGPIEMGTWSFTGQKVQKFTAEIEGTPTEIEVGDTQGVRVPISFSIPLLSKLENAVECGLPEKPQCVVHYQSEGTFTTFCKGNVQNPRPEPGNLCIYLSSAGLTNTTFEGVFDPSAAPFPPEAEGTGRTGAVLLFSPPTGEASGSGTFAVRVP
jgi:hypothetical protein